MPPFRGMGVNDRQQDFTVLAAARQTDQTAPRLLMGWLFGGDDTQLAAYAQAETFNWMEFNAQYGGTERFDEGVSIPEVNLTSLGIHNFVGAPRGWRVGSIGGWNWRARLSLSDALYQATQTNDEFAQYLQSAGIQNFDQATINELNMH